MKKYCLSFLIVLLCFGIYSDEKIVKTAEYTKEGGHKPAVINISDLDPDKAVVEMKEGDKTVFLEAHLYFIRPDGTEVKKKVTSYTVPLYKWFDESNGGLSQFERLEIYYNGERGSSPFRVGNMQVIFKKRPYVKDPVMKPLSVDEKGNVTPAVFSMEEVRGADFVWVEMDNDKPVSIKVQVTGDSERNALHTVSGRGITYQGGSMKRMNSKIFGESTKGIDAGKHLERALGVEDNGAYKEVLVSVEPPEMSKLGTVLEKNTGKAYLKTLTPEEKKAITQKAAAKKNDMDKVWNITYTLLGVLIVGCYLFIRIVYNRIAVFLANFRFLWLISGTRIFYTALFIIWFIILHMLWKSPIIPGQAISDFGILALTFLPLIFLVLTPLQLDQKYKRCSNCRKYISPEYLGSTDLGGTKTSYSSHTDTEHVNTGTEEHSYNADHYVCPECGHDMTWFYSIHSGGKEDSFITNTGRIGTDLMNTNALFNFFLSIAQPYKWYKFYRFIGLLK